MKKSYIFMMLFSLINVPFAIGAQTVPSQIKEVTLFSSQALVKREGLITVKKGLNELLLEIQTFRIDQDSIVARVYGPGEIFSVQFKEIPVKELPQENIKILKQKIDKLKKANWEPLYKVSVPMSLSEIDLTMFSKIMQKTGENWEQVALSISNVIPLSGVRLPSLSSWLLDIPRPQARMMKSGRVAYKKSAPAMDAMNQKAEFEEPEEKAGFATAIKRELPLSFEYTMPQAINIESRDKETILPLFTKKMQGDFYYYAVPKRSSLIFLVCKTKADKELLSGPLNAYFGGQYIGKTYLVEKKEINIEFVVTYPKDLSPMGL